jgi:hypothetical protein
MAFFNSASRKQSFRLAHKTKDLEAKDPPCQVIYLMAIGIICLLCYRRCPIDIIKNYFIIYYCIIKTTVIKS